MIGLLKRLNPLAASVLLLFTCIAIGAAVMAIVHRSAQQAFVAVLTISLIWLFIWLERRGEPFAGRSIESGVRYQRRFQSIQFDVDGLSLSTFGLRYRVRWDEIVAVRLAQMYALSVVQLRLRSVDRLLREMEPHGQRWRLALSLWIERTFHRCDVTLAPAQLGLPAAAFFEEIHARLTPGSPPT